MVFSRRSKDEKKLAAIAEQRRIEDEAPRLRDVVPSLRSLRMRLEDRRAAGQCAAPYTKHVVVATGPALFSVRCGEPRCSGSHDLTGSILAALRAALSHCEGESACQGAVDDVPCDRTLVYVCEAEFVTH